MSTNCFLTKYKAVVQKDNLKVLGRFYLNSATGNNRIGGYNFASTWHIDGNGYFSDSTYTQNLGKVKEAAAIEFIYYVATEPLILWCDDNYQIYGINDNQYKLSVDFRQFNGRNLTQVYCYESIYPIVKEGFFKDAVSTFRITKGDVDIKAFSGSTAITAIFCGYDELNLRGDISSIIGNTGLTKIICFSSGLNGDIADLGGLVSLTAAVFHSGSKHANIHGTVESFVEAQWSNNRRSGTVELDVIDTGCTLNEVPVTRGLSVTFSASNVVVKNGSNETMATYDGSTWTYPA